MSSKQPVATFGPENEAYLTSNGMLSPPDSDGFRDLVQRAYMSSMSHEAIVKVPAFTNSVAGLQICGLTKQTAEEIYERYLRSEFDVELDTFALGFIESKASVLKGVDDGDDWDAALKNMGMTQQKREALLKPEHKDMRMMNTAEGWAKEIVKDTYEWLLGLNEDVSRRRRVQEQELRS
ncbi:hypothetical protein LTR56_009117 [Elasticomyces elasticus]|nr:hypothetical protein LTR56_009117 [Elasticomyces elasticus]KAK4892974.1 hypothetical protein LTR49_028540 [Elasticomyces elasticus]KAK5726239.1 hypothetical protein LTS12_027463 [Elasticomyces elasticus]